MEITVQEFKHCDMITVKGRVDSATAPQLAHALEAASNGGKYKLVVDMSDWNTCPALGSALCLRLNAIANATIAAKLYWLLFLKESERHSNWLASRSSSRPLMILYWLLVTSKFLAYLKNWRMNKVFGKMPPSARKG